ncbi:uncharacterized protein SCHCODRAFT_02339409 [Schizophyllum commune H4-8]|uniref:uncharacterized protein n=1 Tax=Schizophyllum commune (strain H4-8 / FGSC 9210) TaxID=578458 RepID=UPI00215FD890|nr:uncharacterized protein SCHCODRAFT_02339409 [Schizophyllum commune H4-8]KAI5890233.1 hypothetical protein SCHCODRAFT_02339409 [Schizophyllum commune H4-8]
MATRWTIRWRRRPRNLQPFRWSWTPWRESTRRVGEWRAKWVVEEGSFGDPELARDVLEDVESLADRLADRLRIAALSLGPWESGDVDPLTRSVGLLVAEVVSSTPRRSSRDLRRGFSSDIGIESSSIPAGTLVSRQTGDDSLSASGSCLTDLVDILDDAVLGFEYALILGSVVDGDGAR